MIIDGNPIEIAALKEFHKGNRPEGLRIQAEFVEEFRKAYENADHCSCTKDCAYHGNCKECVAIHRAHREHLPNCFASMVNEKIKSLSELTEHSMVKEL